MVDVLRSLHYSSDNQQMRTCDFILIIAEYKFHENFRLHLLYLLRSLSKRTVNKVALGFIGFLQN